MKVTIEFNVDNDAFKDDFAGEVQRILKKANRELGECDQENAFDADGIRLQDSNGNTVGVLRVQAGMVRV